MDLVDSHVDRLRNEISQCEIRLQALKSQLAEAEAHIHNAASGEATNTLPAQNDLLLQKDSNHRNAKSSSGRWPLSNSEFKRYGRQLVMPEVGLKGQCRIRSSSVLIIGAGGLGCPAAAYLAGAGVGTVGLVDGDTVEESNLHRQILHSTSKVGMLKVDSAIDQLRDVNPHVKHVAHREHLHADTALDILKDYDIILDCTDNPASRYLISDSCVILGKPLVSASALRTEGQLMLFNYPSRPPGDLNGGPCYRCMFPKPPPVETVLTCGEGGILGPVVGAMGVLQALEAIKLIAGGGSVESDSSDDVSSNPAAKEPPQALLFSAYSSPPFRSFKMSRRRKACAACSANATVTRESLTSGSMDYIQFCGASAPVNVLSPEDRISATEYSATYHESAETLAGFASGGSHILIDTREKPQFDICSIERSINVPFSRIGRTHRKREAKLDPEDEEWLSLLKTEKANDTIVTVCRLGNDSQLAVKMLRDLTAGDAISARRIVDIRGGLRAWREEVDPDFPEY